MRLLVNKNELHNKKSRESIPFICSFCGKKWSRPKNQIMALIKSNPENIFCSKECHQQYNKEQGLKNFIKLECINCKKKFKRKPSSLSPGNNFCCQSCAAQYNNKKHPKRKRKKRLCKKCGEDIGMKISTSRVYCRQCSKQVKKEKEITYLKRTLKECKAKYGSRNAYHTCVREHARKIASEYTMTNRCAICGYKKIVQVCHIKPIADFPETATLEEVNSPDNLVGLCPTHHIELDKNLLDEKFK